MLTPLAPDLWTLAIDHPFLGLKFGARMTVVRLPDGGVLVHSPVPLTDERRAAVAAIGPIHWIFAPNLFHHLYAGDWAAAFPEARLLAPPGIARKRPELTPHAHHDGSNPWGEGLVAIPFLGQSQMSETTLWHPATRTLLTCDVVANLPPSDHLWTRVYSWMTGLKDKPCVNLILKSIVDDKPQARASLDRMIALAPGRLVMAHGRIVEADATEALRAAWAWLK